MTKTNPFMNNLELQIKIPNFVLIMFIFYTKSSVTESLTNALFLVLLFYDYRHYWCFEKITPTNDCPLSYNSVSLFLKQFL